MRNVRWNQLATGFVAPTPCAVRTKAKSLNPTGMIQHAQAFQSPLLVSRLAFFLTCARCDLDANHRKLLTRHGVQVPTYFLRSARTRRDSYVSKWKLIVSPALYRSWPSNG